MKALRGVSVQKPIPFGPLGLPKLARLSAGAWREQVHEFLQQLDPQHEMETVICTDWAATGALPELLGEDYQIVHSLKDPLTDAVRGLLLFETQRPARAAPLLNGKKSKAEGLSPPEDEGEKFDPIVELSQVRQEGDGREGQRTKINTGLADDASFSSQQDLSLSPTAGEAVGGELRIRKDFHHTKVFGGARFGGVSVSC